MNDTTTKRRRPVWDGCATCGQLLTWVWWRDSEDSDFKPQLRHKLGDGRYAAECPAAAGRAALTEEQA